MPLRNRASLRRRLLEAYLAPEVVAHVMSDGRIPLLSGVRLPVTVLFADLCNFTRLADRLPAERVVAMLDQFFDAMTAAAAPQQGLIDKLIGDAVMIVYGLPRASGDEAVRALYTAGAMHRACAPLLARWGRTLPASVRLGLAVGCASGEAVLANVGSAHRMDYTVIGSAVNLAARLTGAAAPGQTLVSAAVRKAVADTNRFRFSRPRLLRLKGFRVGVAAYPVQVHLPDTGVPHERAVTDPVCGMKLDRAQAIRMVYAGRTVYFCSTTCRAAFRRARRRHTPATRRGTGTASIRGRGAPRRARFVAPLLR